MKKNKFKQKQPSNEVVFIILLMISVSVFMYLARGRYVYAGERALYMDDMAAWNIFNWKNGLSLWNKICDTGANKVRPVNNLILAVIWYIIQDNFELIDTVMMICNIVYVNSFLLILYTMINVVTQKKTYTNQLIATGGALVFASSRFAYYSYEEMFGIMENTASILCLFFLVLLLLDKFSMGVRYWVANIIWLLCVYTHERYLVLVGVLFIYNILTYFENKTIRKNIIVFVITCIETGLMIVHRILLFGNRSFDGTGGTSAFDTFTVKSLFVMLSKQLGYLFGINAIGDTYLNGVDPRGVNPVIYIATIMCYILIALIIKRYWKSIVDYKNDLFYVIVFISAIGCLAISSSITIRVEMRWMYASLGIEIMTIAYMIAVIIKKRDVLLFNGSYLLNILFALVIFIVAIESYYVSHWDNIYNWGIRQEASNLSDCLDTYDDLDDLYIINGSSSAMGSVGIEALVHAEGHEVKNIIFLSGVHEINSIQNDNDCVLYKDGVEYIDLTKDYYPISYIEGHYEDGWCENNVVIKLMSRDSQRIYMEVYTPDYDFLTQGNTIAIYLNGEKVKEIEVEKNSVQEVCIEGLVNGENILNLTSDFWLIDDAFRSENNKLAYVLSKIYIE